MGIFNISVISNMTGILNIPKYVVRDYEDTILEGSYQGTTREFYPPSPVQYSPPKTYSPTNIPVANKVSLQWGRSTFTPSRPTPSPIKKTTPVVDVRQAYFENYQEDNEDDIFMNVFSKERR